MAGIPNVLNPVHPLAVIENGPWPPCEAGCGERAIYMYEGTHPLCIPCAGAVMTVKDRHTFDADTVESYYWRSLGRSPTATKIQMWGRLNRGGGIMSRSGKHKRKFREKKRRRFRKVAAQVRQVIAAHQGRPERYRTLDEHMTRYEMTYHVQTKLQVHHPSQSAVLSGIEGDEDVVVTKKD